jgi:hypothetical protein
VIDSARAADDRYQAIRDRVADMLRRWEIEDNIEKREAILAGLREG